MSIIGILSSNLFSGAAQNTQRRALRIQRPKFQQIKTEFQQLGQDLQSGNLTQAQSDFTTLSQNLSTIAAEPVQPPGAIAACKPFAQLGQDLQSGNLQAAQQDYTTVQQDAQQNRRQQVAGHHGHHHHHAESSQSSSSSSSQQTNPINQAFSALAQDLQAGNLSGAQSDFAAFRTIFSKSAVSLRRDRAAASSAAVPSSTGSLNVTA